MNAGDIDQDARSSCDSWAALFLSVTSLEYPLRIFTSAVESFIVSIKLPSSRCFTTISTCAVECSLLRPGLLLDGLDLEYFLRQSVSRVLRPIASIFFDRTRFLSSTFSELSSPSPPPIPPEHSPLVWSQDTARTSTRAWYISTLRSELDRQRTWAYLLYSQLPEPIFIARLGNSKLIPNNRVIPHKSFSYPDFVNIIRCSFKKGRTDLLH